MLLNLYIWFILHHNKSKVKWEYCSLTKSKLNSSVLKNYHTFLHRYFVISYAIIFDRLKKCKKVIQKVLLFFWRENRVIILSVGSLGKIDFLIHASYISFSTHKRLLLFILNNNSKLQYCRRFGNKMSNNNVTQILWKKSEFCG